MNIKNKRKPNLDLPNKPSFDVLLKYYINLKTDYNLL